MTITPHFFDELKTLTLADLTVNDDGTFTISSLNEQYKRRQVAFGVFNDLGSLHPLLPDSIKLSVDAYRTNTTTLRSNLFIDEVKAAYDFLAYGGVEITSLDRKKSKGVFIHSIRQHKRKMGEAQSFRILLEQAVIKTKKVGTAKVPFVVHINNAHLDVSAVELDTCFPGWTTRYFEAKAMGRIDNLMTHVFNPLKSKMYALDKASHNSSLVKETQADNLVLPTDVHISLS